MTFTYYVLPSVAATLKVRNAMMSASLGTQNDTVSIKLLRDSQVAHISKNLQASYSELDNMVAWSNNSNLSTSGNASVLQGLSKSSGLNHSIGHVKRVKSELTLFA